MKADLVTVLHTNQQVCHLVQCSSCLPENVTGLLYQHATLTRISRTHHPVSRSLWQYVIWPGSWRRLCFQSTKLILAVITFITTDSYWDWGSYRAATESSLVEMKQKVFKDQKKRLYIVNTSKQKGKKSQNPMTMHSVLQRDNYILLPSSVTLPAAPSLETLHRTHRSKTKHEKRGSESEAKMKSCVQHKHKKSQCIQFVNSVESDHREPVFTFMQNLLCILLRSPWYGGHAPAVLIDEVAPSIQNPAVVKGHEGMSGCGRCVLSILSVSILEWGELIFPQHLIDNKFPAQKNTTQPWIRKQQELSLKTEPTL